MLAIAGAVRDSSMVEQRAVNALVPGSSPGRGAILRQGYGMALPQMYYIYILLSSKFHIFTLDLSQEIKSRSIYKKTAHLFWLFFCLRRKFYRRRNLRIQMKTTAPNNATRKLYKSKLPVPPLPKKFIIQLPITEPIMPTTILRKIPCRASVFIIRDATQPTMPPKIIQRIIPINLIFV